MKKAVKISISGTVQGFVFKRFIKDNADKNNVKGFVRTFEDGKAEVFLQGEQEAVDIMASICRRGPASSNMRKVEEKEEKLQDFTDFKIINF